MKDVFLILMDAILKSWTIIDISIMLMRIVCRFAAPIVVVCYSFADGFSGIFYKDHHYKIVTQRLKYFYVSGR